MQNAKRFQLKFALNSLYNGDVNTCFKLDKMTPNVDFNSINRGHIDWLRKEGLPGPLPTNCPDTTNLVVWQHDLDNPDWRKNPFWVIRFFTRGNPIFMIFDQWDCQFGSANRVTCLDAETGQSYGGLMWMIHVQRLRMVMYEDVLVLNLSQELAGYNLITRSKIWSVPFISPMQGSKGFTGIGNKVYLSVTYGSPPFFEPIAGLIEVDIVSGKKQGVNSLRKSLLGMHIQDLSSSLWVNAENGD